MTDTSKYVSHPDIYFHPNPLVRFYFNQLLVEAVKIAGIQPDDIVLDFGCGKYQQLKKFLYSDYVKNKPLKYFGYDVVREWSDVFFIDNIPPPKPDTVFALSVLEHLNHSELIDALTTFKTMCTKLITVIPLERYYSRILGNCVSIHHTENEHKVSFKEIHKILADTFTFEKEKDFFGMARITRWG